MTVESIAGVAEIAAMEPMLRSSAESAAASQGGNFTQMVSQGLNEVNQQLMSTQTDLQKLAVGDVQNLHQVMIHMEEARMSFQLLMQVRNRALEAYQDLMKMSV
jgi:flagellar hook-basal body complex protein FliE